MRALREAVRKAPLVLHAAAQTVSLALLKAAPDPPRVVPAALIAAAQAAAPAVKRAGIQRAVQEPPKAAPDQLIPATPAPKETKGMSPEIPRAEAEQQRTDL